MFFSDKKELCKDAALVSPFRVEDNAITIEMVPPLEYSPMAKSEYRSLVKKVKSSPSCNDCALKWSLFSSESEPPQEQMMDVIKFLTKVAEKIKNMTLIFLLRDENRNTIIDNNTIDQMKCLHECISTLNFENFSLNITGDDSPISHLFSAILSSCFRLPEQNEQKLLFNDLNFQYIIDLLRNDQIEEYNVAWLFRNINHSITFSIPPTISLTDNCIEIDVIKGIEYYQRLPEPYELIAKEIEASTVNYSLSINLDLFHPEDEDAYITPQKQITHVISFLEKVSSKIETLKLFFMFDYEAIGIDEETLYQLERLNQCMMMLTLNNFSLKISCPQGRASQSLATTMVNFFDFLPKKSELKTVALDFGEFELIESSEDSRDEAESVLMRALKKCPRLTSFSLEGRYISFRAQKNLDCFPDLEKMTIRLGGTSEDFSCIDSAINNRHLTHLLITVEALPKSSLIINHDIWQKAIKKNPNLKHLEFHLELQTSDFGITDTQVRQYEREIENFKSKAANINPNLSLNINFKQEGPLRKESISVKTVNFALNNNTTHNKRKTAATSFDLFDAPAPQRPKW